MDIYKELLYPLCDFLISVRLSRLGKGINRSFGIPISDFENFLDTTFENTPERRDQKWRLLKDELEGLADDRDPSGNVCLLRIESSDVLRALSTGKPPQDDVIRLRYSREALIDYVKKSKAGDNALAEADNLNILSAIPSMIDGRIIWEFNGIKMHIKGRNGKNIRGRACLLLYGQQAEIGDEFLSLSDFAERNLAFSDYAQYVPGDAMSVDVLARILDPAEWGVDSEAVTTSVVNALKGLNKRAKEEFHIDFAVFLISGDKVTITNS